MTNFFLSTIELFLFRAMALLEHSLESSPSNFHVKILLVRVYLEAGFVGLAHQVFTLLDAKHIQIDSLGHLHAPLLAPLGHLALAASTLDHAAKFFVKNYKDVRIQAEFFSSSRS